MKTNDEQSGSLHEPGRPLAKDLRSEPAKARDEWLASAEGQKAADSATLVNCGDADYYLKNRLCRAFIAGMEAERRIQEGKRPTDPKLSDGGAWRGSCEGGTKDSIQATEKGGSQ